MVRARVTPRAGHLVPADAQGFERPGDRRLAETPGQGQTLSETDDARKGVDHPEAVRRRPGDQKPAIVGAEIQGRVSRMRAAVADPGRRPSERRVGPACGTQR